MATGNQLKAAILARRAAARGPRKKRTRPEPRQYTVADLERARDRVAAAERRINNDRSSDPHRGRAGLERAQLELSVIESQLRLRDSLSDGSIELSRHPAEHVEGPRSRLATGRLLFRVMLIGIATITAHEPISGLLPRGLYNCLSSSSTQLTGSSMRRALANISQQGTTTICHVEQGIVWQQDDPDHWIPFVQKSARATFGRGISRPRPSPS